MARVAAVVLHNAVQRALAGESLALPFGAISTTCNEIADEVDAEIDE